MQCAVQCGSLGDRFLTSRGTRKAPWMKGHLLRVLDSEMTVRQQDGESYFKPGSNLGKGLEPRELGLFKVIHGYSWLFMVIQGYSRLFKGKSCV